MSTNITIQDLFKKQHELMARVSQSYREGVYDPENHELDAIMPEKMRFQRQDEKVKETKEIILAMTDELHEVLREMPWKYWRKTRTPIEREKLKKEIADCWHFMLELTMLWNMEDEILEVMLGSFKKNEERAQSGY